MRFTPKSDEELAAEGLLPRADYDFEVKDAEDTTSKAGNDMIKVRLHVFDNEGTPHTVWDYLLESMGYKLKSFADATGFSREYANGSLMASDLIGRTGRCKVDIDPEKNGYPAKNVIKSYLRAASAAPAVEYAREVSRRSAPSGNKTSSIDDDSIPF